ncbi:MAG TPA: adenine phosphoribosyltransferase [Candidatus Obscuribacterales bacterium]
MTQQASHLPISREKVEWLKSTIRDIPDFPKPGIVFKDMTTLLKDHAAYQYTIDVLAEKFAKLKPKYIVGIEARGFILGAAIAHKLNIGFIPIRKPGKLPHKVEKAVYDLEYGSDCVEIHADAVDKGDKVVLIDDLLATGGTAEAAARLLKILGAEVAGIGFVVELAFLKGRQKLPTGTEIFSIIQYE